MDKVIIDGVDVSGCEFYIADDKYSCDLSFINKEELCNCDNINDCYYKQLKRLQHYQAEFEHELMNDYTYDGYISPNGFTPIDVIKHIKSELKRLEQENEKLKQVANDSIIEQEKLIAKVNELQAENEKLDLEYHRLKGQFKIVEEALNDNIKKVAELKKYEDMAKKGLEEFKDIGGCWGCGLQLQLNQDMEDIKKLKAENERLKEENYQLQKDCQICENFIDFIPCKPIRDMDYDLQKVISQRDNYYKALQEIRDMAALFHSVNKNKDLDRFKNSILDKINEVIGTEE